MKGVDVHRYRNGTVGEEFAEVTEKLGIPILTGLNSGELLDLGRLRDRRTERKEEEYIGYTGGANKGRRGLVTTGGRPRTLDGTGSETRVRPVRYF